MTRQDKPVRIRTLVGFGMIGQISYLLSQLLTLIALTRLVSVEQVGAFGLASAIVIPVFFFFGLRMQVNFASGQAAGFGFRDYRTLLSVFVVLGYGVIVVVALTWFTGTSRALMIVIGAAKAAECFSQLSYGVFQRHDRMNMVAWSLMARGLGSTIVLIAVLWQTGDLVLAFAVQAFVWIVLAAGLDLRVARRLADGTGDSAAASRARMTALLRSSLHLAAGGFLSALQGNMPRYVIAGLLSVVSLGYFTVVGYAMQAIATLVGTVAESLVSRLSLYLSNGQGEAMQSVMVKLLSGVALLGLVGVTLSLWIGDWLLAAVFGPHYAGLGTLLAVCLVAVSLQGVVLTLQVYLMAARQFARIVLIRILTSTAMLIGCAVGAVMGGLMGVVWGMCAAFCVHIIALAVPARAVLHSATPPIAASPAR